MCPVRPGLTRRTYYPRAAGRIERTGDPQRPKIAHMGDAQPLRGGYAICWRNVELFLIHQLKDSEREWKTARDGYGGKLTRVEEIVVESDDQRGRRCGSLSKCR